MSEFSPIFAATKIREINADIENKKTINEVGEQSATKLQERPTAEEEWSAAWRRRIVSGVAGRRVRGSPTNFSTGGAFHPSCYGGVLSSPSSLRAGAAFVRLLRVGFAFILLRCRDRAAFVLLLWSGASLHLPWVAVSSLLLLLVEGKTAPLKGDMRRDHKGERQSSITPKKREGMQHDKKNWRERAAPPTSIRRT